MSDRTSTVDNTLEAGGADETLTYITQTPVGTLGRLRDWASDCFSSILVKEARQALKSYQFFGTYTIVIGAVVIWSIVVFSSTININRRPDFEEISQLLFSGFCWILGVPLGIVVPFSAFRSLAKEYEDGTIQLISITTMKPYQIVLGKMATAVMQMTIYLSVVAPCIALTYMLDAIPYPLILFLLSIAVGGSIFLTTFGLLLAGATRSTVIGMAFSVFFILGLGGIYLAWIGMISNFVYGFGFNANNFFQTEGQIATYCFGAFFGSTALLMLAAASAQISFDSDNRSTITRLVIVLQLLLIFGAVVIVTLLNQVPFECSLVMASIYGHYWLFIGSMVVGERSGISQRVQRSLPKTLFGKSLFSLLMPGPGRGYLFMVGCLFSSAIAFPIALAFASFVNYQGSPTIYSSSAGIISATELTEIICTSLILLAYPLFYLSATYLLMKGLRAISSFRITGASGPVAGLLIMKFLVFSFSLGSYAIWYNLGGDYGYRYGSRLAQAENLGLEMIGNFNWYFGISSGWELVYNNNSPIWISYIPICAVSALTCLLAFFVAIRDFRYLPTAAPERVQEEIQAEQARRFQSPSAPEGESIDDIFGKLPEPTDEAETRN